MGQDEGHFKVMRDMYDFGQIKSKKWSQKGGTASSTSSCNNTIQNSSFRPKVKMEPMKQGKPPRLLIADGDKGQIMALL